MIFPARRKTRLWVMVIVAFLLSAPWLRGQACVPGGGVSCTTNLNLWLPPANYPDWNTPLNANFTALDGLSAKWGIPPSVNSGEVLIKSGSGAIGSIPGFVYTNTSVPFLNGPTLSMQVQFVATENGVNIGLGAGYYQSLPYNPAVGGLSPNLLACIASDATAHVCPTSANYWNALTLSTGTDDHGNPVAGTILFGYGNCLFDNTAIVGDFITVSTITAGRCHDSGPSLPPSGLVGQVIGAPSGGVAQVNLSRGGSGSGGGSGAAGNNGEVQINNAGVLGAIPGLVYTNSGAPLLDGRSVNLNIAAAFLSGSNMSVTANGSYIEIFPWSSVAGAGLAQGLLACIQADATAHTCTTGATFFNGITYGSPSVSQAAVGVAISGSTPCVFDNATTVGNFAVLSTTVAGECHDSGSATLPVSGVRVGQVVTGPSGGMSTVFIMR